MDCPAHGEHADLARSSRGVVSAPSPSTPSTTRLRLMVGGLVQGVGFRPFTYQVATAVGLSGFVRNSTFGAWIEVEGSREQVIEFSLRLRNELTWPGRIDLWEESWLEPVGRQGFEILGSDTSGPHSALILPDLAMCPDCRRDLFDPGNRRFHYPFTNCTRCGPRYSIILGLPYDRARTSMRGFALCDPCRAEYENPGDRRFHAEPIACPQCGPQVALWNGDGSMATTREEAIANAVDVVRRGEILALKGLGGFQLLVRADLDGAVQRLRVRKGREAKPLAVMCPCPATAEELCFLDPAERRLLESPAAPIVLARRRGGPQESRWLASSVAPDSPWVGVMLPYTPLHHLLLAELGLPVVATSGNRSEEPICIDEHEALRRLEGIADFFLVHDRPIVRPVDDSVARVVLATEQVLRRARGYAPLPVPLPRRVQPVPPILALGSQLKNAIGVAGGGEVVLSQHLGDLETLEAAAGFDRAVADLPTLLQRPPQVVVTDLHPDYLPTQRAGSFATRRIQVPHHEAHAYACLVDNDLEPPVLALSWDGLGLGPDGTLWGGEFLELRDGECHRRASFRSFPLPGGDGATRDTRRSALGLLSEAHLLDHPTARVFLNSTFSRAELHLLTAAIERGINAPRTSSLGRLFDAIASLLRLAQRSRFEGDAAMLLEAAAWEATRDQRESNLDGAHPDACFEIRESPHGLILDWEPFVRRLLDAPSPVPIANWAALWHAAIAAAAVNVARVVRQSHVLLTGGCFQNRLLTEVVVSSLQSAGFSPKWHQRIPPNDGGLAAGQAAAAAYALRRNLPSQPAD